MMQNNIIENIAKRKVKEYFEVNKLLTQENFSKFIEFIGLKGIWSSEDDQKFLWDSIILKASDKKNIDYYSALNGICSFFEQDEGKDIDDIYINIKDVTLNESNNLNESKKNIENEKCIDEFLNSINNNQDTLYKIRFINEIFFSKYINDIKLEDIEKNEETIRINIDEIIKKIKNDYKFININNETLKTYLIYINDNKFENDDNEIKNYYLNKKLINYVNVIIDLKIEENNKNHNINFCNSTLSNISNKNINGNSIELSIEKLSLIDRNIIYCLDGIINQKSNLNFIKKIKKYIENYINYLRQSIYSDLKSKELELQQKIIQSNNTCNKCKNDINKENKKLKEDMSFLLRKNKKGKHKVSSGNSIINVNELMKNNIRNSLSLPKERKRKYTELNRKTFKKIYLSKLSSDNLQKMNNEPIIKSSSKNKLNPQNKKINIIKSRTYSSNDIILEDMTNSRIDLFSNNGNVNGDLIFLETTRLYNDNMDDEEKTISNKTINKINNKNIIQKKLTHSNNKSYYNIIDTSIENNNESSFKISNEDYDDDDFDDIDDNLLSYKKSHNSNNFVLKKNMSANIYDYYANGNNNIQNTNIYQSINNCYNTFAYPMNGQPFLNINKKDYFENKYFYDFKYLAYSNRVKRLFNLNNEKLNVDDFYSEDIKIFFSKKNKQNCILIITSYAFYFLKPTSLECIERINIKSLESITISLNNFNLLLLSFKGGKNGKDIIIESFQRIKVLIFLQQLINKRKLNKDIIINTTNKFSFRNNNGKRETIGIFKNKIFGLTPNFENAQKIGMLLKYEENIFRASFRKKLFVLCSIGLVYFDDNYRKPKTIIPIIGTIIRQIKVQINETIYCLKLITINNEAYIFGSLKITEIMDWKKELYRFRKKYDLQMKKINPNYSRKSSRNDNKDDDDFFSIKENK